MSSCFLIINLINLHVTEAAVSSRPKIAVNSEGRLPFFFFFNRRLPKRKIWLRINNKKGINAYLLCRQHVIEWRISRFVGKLWVQKSRLFLRQLRSVHVRKHGWSWVQGKISCRKKWFPKFRVQKIISTGLKRYQVTVCDGITPWRDYVCKPSNEWIKLYLISGLMRDEVD